MDSLKSRLEGYATKSGDNAPDKVRIYQRGNSYSFEISKTATTVPGKLLQSVQRAFTHIGGTKLDAVTTAAVLQHASSIGENESVGIHLSSRKTTADLEKRIDPIARALILKLKAKDGLEQISPNILSQAGKRYETAKKAQITPEGQDALKKIETDSIKSRASQAIRSLETLSNPTKQRGIINSFVPNNPNYSSKRSFAEGIVHGVRDIWRTADKFVIKHENKQGELQTTFDGAAVPRDKKTFDQHKEDCFKKVALILAKEKLPAAKVRELDAKLQRADLRNYGKTIDVMKEFRSTKVEVDRFDSLLAVLTQSCYMSETAELTKKVGHNAEGNPPFLVTEGDKGARRYELTFLNDGRVRLEYSIPYDILKRECLGTNDREKLGSFEQVTTLEFDADLKDCEKYKMQILNESYEKADEASEP